MECGGTRARERLMALTTVRRTSGTRETPGEARVAPGGYRVTATWSFASGSQHASWLGCHVPIVEADGTPRLRADGTPVVRTMLFPKSSTEFCDIWHTIGLRGTASNQYSVKDLFVPEAYSVDVLSRRDGSEIGRAS